MDILSHQSGLPARMPRISFATSARTFARAYNRSFKASGPIRILPDASCLTIRRPGGGLRASGGEGGAHQKGSRRFTHDAFTFAPVQLEIQREISSSFPMGGPPMEQIELPLLCRLDAPSVVPPRHIAELTSYRDAVRLCWMLRRVRNMTQARLAEEAGLYPAHVNCYLRDGEHQRDLPGSAVRGFQLACGNTAISQWLALQGQLTVLEEIQAGRVA
jgi:hypothetical protein